VTKDWLEDSILKRQKLPTTDYLLDRFQREKNRRMREQEKAARVLKEAEKAVNSSKRSYFIGRMPQEKAAGLIY
jgi:hypothetical protein